MVTTRRTRARWPMPARIKPSWWGKRYPGWQRLHRCGWRSLAVQWLLSRAPPAVRRPSPTLRWSILPWPSTSGPTWCNCSSATARRQPARYCDRHRREYPPGGQCRPRPTLVSVEPVQLDGSGSSDVDGDPLTLSWSFTSRPAGSEATLSDPTLVNPTFVVDGGYLHAAAPGQRWHCGSLPDTVRSPPKLRPVANAGRAPHGAVPHTVHPRRQRLERCRWQSPDLPLELHQPARRQRSHPLNPKGLNPTFIADVVGIYMAQLIVNDGTVDSPPVTVIVTTQLARWPMPAPQTASVGTR